MCFFRKIQGLRGRSPLEPSGLELSFRIFPLTVDCCSAKKVQRLKKTTIKMKNSNGQGLKKGENHDFEGSGLRKDQSPCVKKPFLKKTNHICTDLFVKNRIPSHPEAWHGHECKFGVFRKKLQFPKPLRQDFYLHRFQIFLVWWSVATGCNFKNNLSTLIYICLT
jgi:hypothetical protein